MSLFNLGNLFCKVYDVAESNTTEVHTITFSLFPFGVIYSNNKLVLIYIQIANNCIEFWHSVKNYVIGE